MTIKSITIMPIFELHGSDAFELLSQLEQMGCEFTIEENINKHRVTTSRFIISMNEDVDIRAVKESLNKNNIKFEEIDLNMKEPITVNVMWLDAYMEDFECTEVRFGQAMLWMRLTSGQNRHVPYPVRWFSVNPESDLDNTPQQWRELTIKEKITVNIRWHDGYLETFECSEVRFGQAMIWMRLTSGQNRYVPYPVRWFSVIPESHECTPGNEPGLDDLTQQWRELMNDMIRDIRHCNDSINYKFSEQEDKSGEKNQTN